MRSLLAPRLWEVSGSRKPETSHTQSFVCTLVYHGCCNQSICVTLLLVNHLACSSQLRFQLNSFTVWCTRIQWTSICSSGFALLCISPTLEERWKLRSSSELGCPRVGFLFKLTFPCEKCSCIATECWYDTLAKWIAVCGYAANCNPQAGDVSTWLILPVVICLSQRLSHACLSISFYTAKLRMAH